MDFKEAQEQVARLKCQNLFNLIEQSAAAEGLPLAFVCAIASRETNCDNKLGDWRGGIYHGVGVMQIDIQHAIAQAAVANRTWKDHPGPLIDFGCQLLKRNFDRVLAQFPDLDPDERLRFTAASYNAGYGGAERGHQEGDCDKLTTGHNYGADVMMRRVWFEQALAAGPRPPRQVATR